MGRIILGTILPMTTEQVDNFNLPAGARCWAALILFDGGRHGV
jgi:hypothetical protein